MSSLMQARKRVPTNGPIVFQQVCKISTEIPSAPGAVLAQPMVHMRISSFETWSFQGIRSVSVKGSHLGSVNCSMYLQYSGCC